ncbi:ATP-binding cassette domain-containing protein [Streptomyces sp. NBC_00841]|uniref:ABC transporter ATP-binding protein n=1 Tax=unclassified Streptomyces TaxID=2593676 RepID=UPI00224E4260|nr:MULTISPECIES: ATP-binding cassette domain-containing protein [unclassified Streptomyces]MCX4530878.1 ATP-binding cassette domain-containing protein [Streptomyces sp. NBC_01669]WSA03375.1 ATP-binding cassette domain-containing protein [Streptomyces sp. NBC_00841]
MRRCVAELKDVSVLRPSTGQVILDRVDWSVGAGEHWALLGPNGAGKTTMLRLIGALTHPTRGTVDVLGHRIGRVDLRELRTAIGFVSPMQEVPHRATAHTVVLTGATGTVQPLWRAYGPAIRDRAHELLAELDCKDLADRPYGVCSGGQRARVLIARALMSDPSLLLLDEPYNALDLPSREDVIDAVQGLAESRGELATVTVTHYLEELPASTGHALLLREGRVQASGPVDEVLTGERMTDCFLRSIEVERRAGRWTARSGGGR